MRHLIIVLSVLFGAVIPAGAEVSVGIGIGMPNVHIGINLGGYPQFEPVPGYPVYYAPQVPGNFFFYDGMYWVYQDDYWYASSWYNGPWALVSPMVVPVYILRVPVRYYRYPPMYFRGWQPDAPPRWGDHWGHDWQRQRNGWDHWDRNSAPPPAPLPTYQRQYSGGRYPSYEQQRAITSQNYRYQPHDPVVQQHYQRYVATNAPAPSGQKPPPPSQHQPHQQQPPGPQGPGAGDVGTPAKPPQQHEPAQPSHQEYGPPGQGGEKASKEPKQDQGRDQTGDQRPDKEEQRDNR